MSVMQFVLVHGACHGGWCWKNTATHLRKLGCKVSTPTLPGLGKKANLLSASTDLNVMAEDIIRQIEVADLRGVHLVGHSFGGAIITAVADKIADRLSHLIYLDAAWIEDGQSLFDTMDPEIVASRRALVQEQGGGIALPAPSPEAFGVIDPEQSAQLRDLLTPHPIASYETPLTLSNPVMNGLLADYVICTNPLYGPLSNARDRVSDVGLAIHELQAPHDAMITHPIKTAEMIFALSNRNEKTD